MIDERFSSAAFESEGRNTRQSLQLSGELANEVLAELHDALSAAMSRIVERLNSMGHQLSSIDPGVLDEIDYHDCRENEAGEDCRLRLTATLIVSHGYSHYSKDQPSDDEDVDWLQPESWPDNRQTN